MPYDSNAKLPKSIRDALPEHAQTIFRKAFNSASEQYGTENEARLMKVAWGAVKNVYEKKDDKWVLKKGKSAVSSATKPLPKEDGWFPVAKVGQAVRFRETGELKYPTKEAFEKAVNTWKNGRITTNHDAIWDEHKIIDEKFNTPFLYMKLEDDVKNELEGKETTGGSIEVIPLEIEGDSITDMVGIGYSILYNQQPLCTPEMGCASVISKSNNNPKIDFDIVVLNNRRELVKVRDVNLYLDKDEMKNEKIVKDQLLAEVAYLGQQVTTMFYEHNPKLKIGDVIPKDLKPIHTIQIAISAKGNIELEYHEGGGKGKMGKEGEEPVTYTGEQTKEMIASAVAEVTEKADNAHAVEITKLKEAGETKIKELETEHGKAVTEAEEVAFKRAQARIVFMQKFALKDDSELMKKYDEVKTVEDMQGLVNSMEIPMVANAAAGISSASGGEEPKVEKVEEVGSYDPIKGEWVPTFREVSI